MIADAIILSCIAILAVILFFLALTVICWLIQRWADEESEDEPMSDYDPKFKQPSWVRPKHGGQKDTPR